MTLKKYISFETASKDLWVLNPDQKYYEKLKRLFILWNKLNPQKPVRGIKKFRNYNDFMKYKIKF